MTENWRLLQIFLARDEVEIYEVQISTKTKELRCTCPKDECEHIRFVKRRMDRDGGYNVKMPGKVTQDHLEEAKKSPAHMRNFIVRHSKIEVV